MIRTIETGILFGGGAVVGVVLGIVGLLLVISAVTTLGRWVIGK